MYVIFFLYRVEQHLLFHKSLVGFTCLYPNSVVTSWLKAACAFITTVFISRVYTLIVTGSTASTALFLMLGQFEFFLPLRALYTNNLGRFDRSLATKLGVTCSGNSKNTLIMSWTFFDCLSGSLLLWLYWWGGSAFLFEKTVSNNTCFNTSMTSSM